eukprot:scaffold260_cov328-Prasinococcus_capsulatus_cf.AAC.19
MSSSRHRALMALAAHGGVTARGRLCAQVAEFGVPGELLEKDGGALSELVDRTGRKTSRSLRRKATSRRMGSSASICDSEGISSTDASHQDLTRLDK